MCMGNPAPPPPPVKLPEPVKPIEPIKDIAPLAPPPAPEKTATSFGKAAGTKMTAAFNSSDGRYKSLIIPRSNSQSYTALNIPGAR